MDGGDERGFTVRGRVTEERAEREVAPEYRYDRSTVEPVLAVGTAARIRGDRAPGIKEAERGCPVFSSNPLSPATLLTGI